jgi:protease I
MLDRPVISAFLIVIALAAQAVAQQSVNTEKSMRQPSPAHSSAPRVLMLVGEGSEPDEFGMPFETLSALGYQIDIASYKLEQLPLMPGRGSFKDPVANVLLDQVDISKYLGLILPGGNSPGHLEVYPKSLDICRAFMEANKPVSGICHGPRLLIQAGMLKNRLATCLFTVPNEIPDVWVTGAYGKYLDQPVVVDGRLTTSRYPYDLLPFTRTTVDQLASVGGIAPVGGARALIFAPGAAEADAWVFNEVPQMCGLAVTMPERDKNHPSEAGKLDAGDFDLLVLINATGQDTAAFAKYSELAEVFKAAGKPVVIAGQTGLSGTAQIDYDRAAVLAAIVSAARSTPRGQAAPHIVQTVMPKLATFQPPVDADHYDAALALRAGFDDQVAAQMLAWLQQQGKTVLIIGQDEKPVRGINGLALTPIATYADVQSLQSKLAADALIVVPGSYWPEKGEARQGVKTPWLDRQDELDEARMQWLLGARDRGATLVVFGNDSMRMAADPRFKGKRFAGSDQAFWAFKKTGARYADTLACKSDERIYTVRNASGLDEIIKLLAAR